MNIIKNLLKLDMLLSDNLKSMPYFLNEEIPEEYKAKKKKFFNTKELTDKYVPNLKDFTSAQLSRMCRIEHFDIDIDKLYNNNELAEKSSDILFNYYSRDIITNHADICSINI